MKDIDKILNKYFEGETSLEEENILRNYFLHGTIEERHRIYAPMFDFFTEEREKVTKVTKLTDRKKKKLPIYIWISIAASLLLLITVKSIYTNLDYKATKSIVYIDGKKVTNKQIINSEALHSLENISDMEEDIVSSQIGILDSFTE
ncbi:MAG: hypothetical protein E6767_08215 [Dysgonomonas sp.]|nr:hypothetical protein [Dysgonomonas sp.]